MGKNRCLADDFLAVIQNDRFDRAHQHAVDAEKNVETGKQEQELGRSKGGFSSKLHAACDALGNPLRFFVTAGQNVKALDLISGCDCR